MLAAAGIAVPDWLAEAGGGGGGAAAQAGGLGISSSPGCTDQVVQNFLGHCCNLITVILMFCIYFVIGNLCLLCSSGFSGLIKK